MSTSEDQYLLLLGKRISQIRNDKGITQYRLAKMLFMEQSNLARIEDGNTNPTIKTLLKITAALDISMHELFADIASSK